MGLIASLIALPAAAVMVGLFAGPGPGPAPAATAAATTSAAWPGGRPPECATPASRSGPGAYGVYNVWERAKSPVLRRYCDLVAGAASKLAGNPAMAEAALGLAQEADSLLPQRAAPRVLEGRALAMLGRASESLAALQAARDLDPGSLDDPPALLAWARALARAGSPEATEAYQRLLPRTGSLGGSERASAEVEAGLVAMAAGPGSLDDSIAALREAVRQGQDETQAVAVLALALALERQGDAEQARGILADRVHGDPRSALDSARAKAILALAPRETPAIVALALESADPPGARDAWGQYLEGSPGGPWSAQANAHLAALVARHGPSRTSPASRPSPGQARH